MTLPLDVILKSKFLTDMLPDPFIDSPQSSLDLFLIPNHEISQNDLYIKAHTASKYGLPLNEIVQEISNRISGISSPTGSPTFPDLFSEVLENNLGKIKNNFGSSDILATDPQKRNVIHVAARYNRTEIVEFLQFKMPNNLLDIAGHTPLYRAAVYNHLKTVRILLKSANPLSAIFNIQGKRYEIPSNIRRVILKRCPKYFWDFLLASKGFNSEVLYTAIEIHLNITNTKYFFDIEKLLKNNFENLHTPDSAFVFVFGKIDP